MDSVEITNDLGGQRIQAIQGKRYGIIGRYQARKPPRGGFLGFGKPLVLPGQDNQPTICLPDRN